MVYREDQNNWNSFLYDFACFVTFFFNLNVNIPLQAAAAA